MHAFLVLAENTTKCIFKSLNGQPKIKQVQFAFYNPVYQFEEIGTFLRKLIKKPYR